MSLYLNIPCAISVLRHCAQNNNYNFSDDVHFLHPFYLKFIINANIVYIPLEATFSMF